MSVSNNHEHVSGYQTDEKEFLDWFHIIETYAYAHFAITELCTCSMSLTFDIYTAF